MFCGSAYNSIYSLFEKKFKYTKSSQWILPSAEELFHDNEIDKQVDSLQDLKEHLNSVKSKLNDYPTEYWNAHTKRRNPAQHIIRQVKFGIKAEFVTQAWCKFYECIHQFSLVPTSKLNSLHLCEAPGAFVTALNHYLYSTFPDDEIKWNWLASSLNPYHESNPITMISDDRFILHTFKQWIFCDNFTGDITDMKNIEDIAAAAQKLGKIDLITADGSVDCMETPELQEENVLFLHFAEICSALFILSQGGSFVIKMFTIFDIATVSMMYLLNCVFREVNVFKPATSKSGNSEIYIVCLGFDENAKNFNECFKLMLNQLKNKMNAAPPLIRKSLIPNDFLMQHEVCARMFMQYQINTIESNIYHYENPTVSDAMKSLAIREQAFHAYSSRYKINPIPEEKSILYRHHAQIKYGYFSKEYCGSFTERSNLNKLSSKDKFEILKKKYESINFSDIIENSLSTKNIETLHQEFLSLTYNYGKLVEQLHSSSFVNKCFLQIRQKIEIIFPHLCNTLKILDSHCELVSTAIHNNNTLKIFYFDANLYSMDYGLKEKQFLRKILEKLITNENIEKIIFHNYPFLTHYAVSLLKVLSINYFCEISIKYDNYTIELTKRKNLNTKENNNIKSVNININDLNDTVFSFIEIKELHNNEFSEVITDFNNVIFKKFFDTIFLLPYDKI